MKIDEFDIRKDDELCEEINRALKAGEILEIKNENYHGEINIVLVQISRKVRNPKRPKK